MPKPTAWRPILAQWGLQSDQTHREQSFQAWLAVQLAPYFTVRHECEGRTLRGGEARRIDFLCWPRPSLAAHWGRPVVFGIECKYPLGWTGGNAVRQWIGQMVEYRHCAFDTRQGPQIPHFILSAPPLLEVVEQEMGLGDDLARWTQRIAHECGLGELHFYPRSYESPRDYAGNMSETILEIRFNGTGCFWSNRRPVPPVSCWPGKHILEPRHEPAPVSVRGLSVRLDGQP